MVEAVKQAPAQEEGGFFMRRTHMPSILCFSTVLCYYGSKLQMRRLLFCLAKGGRKFFHEKVKNGHFFKSTLIDSNLINLNN